MAMKRLIVTGANGSGKSTLAATLHRIRPDIPLFSFDAIKLARNWQQKCPEVIEEALAEVLAKDAWILEGGPSLLESATPRANAVLWLDPPEALRLWRLVRRPLRNAGWTRPELPEGNIDWPLQQYRFAVKSFRKRSKVRQMIARCLDEAGGTNVWHCTTQEQIDKVVSAWRQGD